uniref:Uncharacterized protein n=1 Tax=Oryza nivara TaxID=4536 RepID=A0A0E0I019_ORYNI
MCAKPLEDSFKYAFITAEAYIVTNGNLVSSAYANGELGILGATFGEHKDTQLKSSVRLILLVLLKTI